MSNLTIEEKIEEGHIHARIVIEILGKPKEHVHKTLSLVLEKLRTEKHVEVVKYEQYDTQKQDDSDMFTAFAEVELLAKDTDALFNIMYEYMPSSIEIIDMESKELTPHMLSDISMDFLGRMHQADSVAKQHVAESGALRHAFAQLVNNTVLYALEFGELTEKQLAKKLGLDEKTMEAFINKAIETKRIEKKGKKLTLSK